MQNPSCSFS